MKLLLIGVRALEVDAETVSRGWIGLLLREVSRSHVLAVVGGVRTQWFDVLLREASRCPRLGFGGGPDRRWVGLMLKGRKGDALR